MKTTPFLTAGLTFAMLQGCTNYLYTGKFTADDSQGKPRAVVMYWPKTDPWLGRQKAGPAILLTECGVPIRFDQQPEGIVFRGTPGDDEFAEGPTPNASEFECGRFTGDAQLVDLDSGPLSFVIQCKPVTDEFSAFPRSYIGARNDAYEVGISSVVRRSILGKVPEAPAPPECRDRD